MNYLTCSNNIAVTSLFQTCSFRYKVAHIIVSARIILMPTVNANERLIITLVFKIGRNIILALGIVRVKKLKPNAVL